MKKEISNNITSYDLLKTIAVILMICDHVGFYFMDNETWMRILGRMCVPIWFFLIGFSNRRDVPLAILLGAGLISAGTILAGEVVLPVSILITLMIGRNFIDVWMRAVIKGGDALLGLFFILLMLAYPSGLLFEYGTLGLMFTVFGAFCRIRMNHPEIISSSLDRQMYFFGIASIIIFCGIQAAAMTSLSGLQFLTLLVGLMVVFFILNRFESSELPHLTRSLPVLIKKFVQVTGRKTLEIYVIHLLVFKALAVWMMPERFQFLQWQWMYPATKSLFDFIFLK